MKNIKIFIGTLFLSLLIIQSGCESENFDYQPVTDPPSAFVDLTITGFVNSIDGLSILSAALAKTGLDQTLNSGMYTLIAPEDKTFQKYLNSTPYKTIADYPVDELEKLLKHHIVANQELLLFDPISLDRQKFTPLGGADLEMWYNNDVPKNRYYRMFVNGIQISTQGWRPTNGVVHVTNRGVLSAGA